MSPEALRRLIVAGHEGTHFPVPAMRLIDADGWYRTITPGRTGSYNEVARARIAPDRVEAEIDRVCEEQRALGLELRWVVAFDSEPAELIAASLDRRGFESWDAVGMWAPSSLAIGPGAVSVERVDDPETEAMYCETFARGWGGTAEQHLADHRLGDGRHHLFLASIDGAPVGVAAYVDKGDSAYLTSAVVLEGARGQGAYRALLAARLRAARDASLEIVTTQARISTSAPILARLGFTEMYRFRMFRSRTPRASSPR